jgi:radical SAM protein with 4Fe4S-binding SPASM domain
VHRARTVLCADGEGSRATTPGTLARIAAPSLTPPLPRELQVEVTGACNLRCRMCLVRYAPTIGRREGALSYEQFLELVDGLPDLRRLTLQGLGEPLLSPHLLDMVAHASARGIDVGFNTNAVLLDRARTRRLIELGLGWLHVSLDGATAATYEQIRHGTTFQPRPGQFERVVANLRRLVALRSAAGAARPHVEIVFVAMRRNVDELPLLVELAADIGVDRVHVQNLSHTFDDTDPAGAYHEIRAYAAAEALFGPGAEERRSAAYDDARARAQELGVGLRLPGRGLPPDRAPGCGWPWTSAYVTHRGEVQPCCMVMGSDRATLGRLDERSFAEIWHGDAYREFRSGLLGDDPPTVCAGCSLYHNLF